MSFRRIIDRQMPVPVIRRLGKPVNPMDFLDDRLKKGNYSGGGKCRTCFTHPTYGRVGIVTYPTTKLRDMYRYDPVTQMLVYVGECPEKPKKRPQRIVTTITRTVYR